MPSALPPAAAMPPRLDLALTTVEELEQMVRAGDGTGDDAWPYRFRERLDRLMLLCLRFGAIPQLVRLGEEILEPRLASNTAGPAPAQLQQLVAVLRKEVEKARRHAPVHPEPAAAGANARGGTPRASRSI